MMTTFALAAALSLLQDGGEARRILERFEAARPAAKELAVYEHDWAPTLAAAKERAAKENRPIFLIAVTNSYGDMFTGHC
jgi:hypothetical protein